MGSATGSTSVQNVDLYTPQQQQQMEQMLGVLGPQIMQFLGGDTQELFQQAYIDPAMSAYNQDIIPAIQERMGGDTGASSALNQTLAQSAENLGTMLGSQMGQFAQNQQNQMMNMYSNLLGNKMFEPVMTQKQGWAEPLLGAGMKLGGAALGGPIGSAMADWMFKK